MKIDLLPCPFCGKIEPEHQTKLEMVAGVPRISCVEQEDKEMKIEDAIVRLKLLSPTSVADYEAIAMAVAYLSGKCPLCGTSCGARLPVSEGN